MFGFFEYPGRDRRQGPRRPQRRRVRLLLGGMEQPAETIDVSSRGVLVQTPQPYEPGAEVLLHDPVNLNNRLFRVVWSQTTGETWTIALEFQERERVRSWGYH
jgi:hypothetical protein